MSPTDFTQKLQNFMFLVGIDSFKALSRAAGVSERQILRLRHGELAQMRVEVLFALAQVLKVSLNELITAFSSLNFPDFATKESDTQNSQTQNSQTQNSQTQNSQTQNSQIQNSQTQNSQIQNSQTQNLESLQKELTTLKQEYSRSRIQLEEQKDLLQQEFQRTSLQSLESLLLQFPTAAQKARENPKLAAVNLLPLVQKPLEKLLHEWGIEVIAVVGSEIPYNPQEHQLLEGNAQLGDIVKVRYIGYRQGEKLLYRAKVIPLNG